MPLLDCFSLLSRLPFSTLSLSLSDLEKLSLGCLPVSPPADGLSQVALQACLFSAPHPHPSLTGPLACLLVTPLCCSPHRSCFWGSILCLLLPLCLCVFVPVSFQFFLCLSVCSLLLSPCLSPGPICPSLGFITTSYIGECLSSRFPPFPSLASPLSHPCLEALHLSSGPRWTHLTNSRTEAPSLPPPAHRRPHRLSRDFLSLTFPAPQPASVYANPRGGGTFACPPHPLLPVPLECGGAGLTQGHTAEELRWSQLQPPPPAPPSAPNHPETQVAEGTPDMPLCLSPSRLDGPHFSCLVSRGPGGGGGPTWPTLTPPPQFPLPLLPVTLSF